ncbi:MAG: hypothetical protein ACLPUO_26295 [Streptosporangiaceae bacterium]
MADDEPVGSAGQGGGQGPVRGECRWPMAVAVIVVIVLTVLLPNGIRTGPRWALLLAGVLLVAVILADPGRIDRRSRLARLLSLALLAVLMATALTSTLLLIHLLIKGGGITRSGPRLLLVGNGVWVINVIVFGLLYWELDGGGPAARTYHKPVHPDLAFPQHMNPELAPAGWRPLFFDYLYLGLTSALAFSPTDTMPMVRWAKAAMGAQSLISIGVLGLVIARAVNIFA